jgi:hypothetical protein
MRRSLLIVALVGTRSLSSGALSRDPVTLPPRAAKSCKLQAMEWTDEGIVLGVRRHGESSAIVELLTRSHGRHLGLVRGGAGKRMRPLLQPGNSVTTVWRARLDEHLGYYVIEGTRLRAATLLGSAHATMASPIWPRWCGCCRSAIRTKTSTTCSSARWTISTTSAMPPCIWCGLNLRCWPNSASGSIWKTAPRPARPPS